MNIFSLFEEEELANILIQVIKKQKPKSVLQNTDWWNFIISQSLVDESYRDFIKYFWPTINPRFILWELQTLGSHKQGPNYADISKIHDSLRDILFDKKLIEIIKEEQLEIIRKGVCKLPLNGPKLKPLKVSTKTGEINCVATNGDVAYENIYNFLIDLSKSWIDGLSNFSPNIDCSSQMFDSISTEENQERDSELAEVIFSNFPKTFDYCEKDYFLYICGWNWNLTKEKPKRNQNIN